MTNDDSMPSKVTSVRRRIHELAQLAGVGAKLATVRDLCTLCQASLSTVDRALFDLEAQGILIRRHGSGIYVAPTALCKRVCLLMGSDALSTANVSPIYSTLLRRLNQVGRERHWEVSPHVVMSSFDQERRPLLSKELRYALDAGFIDGAISTITLTEEMAAVMSGNGIPVAAFLPTERRPSVIGLAYGDLARQGVVELAALGRRRLALVTVLGLGRRFGFREDLDGFAEGLAACGLAAGPDAVRDVQVTPVEFFTEATVLRWRQHGYTSTRALLASPEPPDGIVVTDDMAASGVLQALREHGATGVAVATHMNKGLSPLNAAGLDLIGLEFDPVYIVDRLLSLLDDLFNQRAGMDRCELIQPQVNSERLQRNAV